MSKYKTWRLWGMRSTAVRALSRWQRMRLWHTSGVSLVWKMGGGCQSGPLCWRRREEISKPSIFRWTAIVSVSDKIYRPVSGSGSTSGVNNINCNYNCKTFLLRWKSFIWKMLWKTVHRQVYINRVFRKVVKLYLTLYSIHPHPSFGSTHSIGGNVGISP